jgi:hypothetical protein
MKNNYISHVTMPHFSQFLSERGSKIRVLVNQLKFPDVEKDEDFEKSKQKIKNAILLTPVAMGVPVFKDYEYEERNIRVEQRFFDGQPSRDNYIHEISFPFTGSQELFNYSPSSYSTRSSDHGLIKPSTSNSVTVYVELNEISPDSAISQAHSLIRLTNEFVEGNSKEVKTWNTAIEKHIDDVMEAKQNELFRIFGKK